MISKRLDLTRRQWVLGLGAAANGMAQTPLRLERNVPGEWSFTAGRTYKDPFSEVECNALFTGPEGRTWRVPGFWAGANVWKVRFAAAKTGSYRFRTEANVTADGGLHGREGTFEIVEYGGSNPLFRHGPIRISRNGRYFEHEDGTPFFFLGDDWWLGMTRRLRFPDEFRTLAEDRVRKGYTTIKLTAGLNTDCTEFDPRSENEGGQPWEPGYASIRPSFFDWADKRVRMLIELGLAPSIVGSWGFYLKSMGIEKMCRHWRYCLARWGAYPVTWQLAMENDLPYYLSETGKEDIDRAQREWTEVGKYLKRADPFRRPVTMQSWSTRDSALGGLREPGILDFDSLHMGHTDRESATNCIRVVRKLHPRQPAIPVVPGEVVFEGIGWTNWQNTQRLVFWGSMLNGASGFCYGANGIWQFNRRGEPFGASPQGTTWGGDAWDVAMNYPGSRQVGLGKKLLARYPFWKIEPHPEWIEPRPREAENMPPFGAGIPGELRLFYLAHPAPRDLKVTGLEQGPRYRAFWFDPVSGTESPIGKVQGDADGRWPIPPKPGIWDFVLVLEMGLVMQRS